MCLHSLLTYEAKIPLVACITSRLFLVLLGIKHDAAFWTSVCRRPVVYLPFFNQFDDTVVLTLQTPSPSQHSSARSSSVPLLCVPFRRSAIHVQSDLLSRWFRIFLILRLEPFAKVHTSEWPPSMYEHNLTSRSTSSNCCMAVRNWGKHTHLHTNTNSCTHQTSTIQTLELWTLAKSYKARW